MNTNQPIRLKKSPTLIILAAAMSCFALLPLAQAVVPAPDGGYPGFNTAEGQNALFSLTTGSANTAVGWFSLWSNAEGGFNTATGAGALLFNTADQNTAVGAAALLFNATGVQNTAVGAAALLNNTTGQQNTATGVNALRTNQIGAHNTAVGTNALFANTESNNTAIGDSALFSNTIGFQNTANGRSALGSNTEGEKNTANGFEALENNTTGSRNTANGYDALLNNVTGDNNTAIGDGAGLLISGDGNVCIGAGIVGEAGQSNITRIRNIGSTPIVGGTNVVVSGTGGIGHQILGYASSSRRYKEDIKPMDQASEMLFALKPVTFRAKGNMDPARVRYYGLIAEEVATLDPDLVVYSQEGKPETLRFDSINAMMLNEFLKEHRTVQDLKSTVAKQEATIARQRTDFEAIAAQQRKEIASLAATLKEQAAQIQKVSAQIAVIKPAPQMVSSNP